MSPLTGDREFESISLQRRVINEPVLALGSRYHEFSIFAYGPVNVVIAEVCVGAKPLDRRASPACPGTPARYGAATPGSRLERAAGLLAMRLARDRYGPTGVERWSLVIKHDDGRRSMGGDFRNVPTIREIATQAQFASGRKGESGFAIRCPDDTSPTAFRISVGVVKALRSQ